MTGKITVPTSPPESVRLPDTLSELTLLAVNDLKAARKTRKYEIYMGQWHAPYDGKCSICAAGSIMAITLKSDPDERLSPNSFDDDTRRKLEAVNDLRCGAVGEAFLCLKSVYFSTDLDEADQELYWKYEALDRDVPTFNPHDPRPFYRAMEKLAADLKEAGF
jgi:hypothetical protein